MSEGIDEAEAMKIKTEAEGIYQRWANEEFDLDPVKAGEIPYTVEVFIFDKKGELTKEKMHKNAADFWLSAVSHWPIQRALTQGGWLGAARNLIMAHNLIRVNGCLVVGSHIKQELQVREHRIIELDLELKQAKDRLADLDRRFKECGDRVVDLETQNQKLRESNPVFGIAQSSVDSVAEDATKKENKT